LRRPNLASCPVYIVCVSCGRSAVPIPLIYLCMVGQARSQWPSCKFLAVSRVHFPFCVPRLVPLLPVIAWLFPRFAFILSWEAHRFGRHVSVRGCLVVSLVVSGMGGVGVRQVCGLPCAPRGRSSFPRTAPL